MMTKKIWELASTKDLTNYHCCFSPQLSKELFYGQKQNGTEEINYFRSQGLQDLPENFSWKIFGHLLLHFLKKGF